jgi:hypothetical protein
MQALSTPHKHLVAQRVQRIEFRIMDAIAVSIASKLPLSKPQAFVITLEQPGGVVKSKQEKVVALAKPQVFSSGSSGSAGG